MTSLKQKLIVILVVSLFMLSILPVGLADEGKKVLEFESDEEESDAEDDADDDNEVNSESKSEVETEDDDSEDKEKEVKFEVKNKTRVKNGSLKREIKQNAEVLKIARERLEEAKERFKNATEDQREHRQKVLDLDKAVKRCNPKNDDCALLKGELRVGVKNHLLKSVQVVQRSLEKLTKTVEKMEDLSEEEKEFALSLVADLQAELDTQKTNIDSFTNETSQEDIRAAIKDLKELNQKAHKMQRKLVGLLVNAKLNVLVEKNAELQAGMQARIDALAETGADVSELEAILAEFEAKSAELEQDFKTAQEKWMEAKDAEDFDQFNRELREAQHKVREDLQESKKILREFLAKYKELTEGTEDTEEEVPENETEEDSEGVNESEEAENETESDSDVESDTGVDTNTTLPDNTGVETNTSVEANTSTEVTA